MGIGILYQLFVAKAEDRLHAAALVVAIEDFVDGELACHILDLATAELVAACQFLHLLIGELRYLAVSVGCEIGRSNQDALEGLHFLQNDVLHGVEHLVYRVLHLGQALAKDRVGLVEEQNRGYL